MAHWRGRSGWLESIIHLDLLHSNGALFKCLLRVWTAMLAIRNSKEKEGNNDKSSREFREKNSPHKLFFTTFHPKMTADHFRHPLIVWFIIIVLQGLASMELARN